MTKKTKKTSDETLIRLLDQQVATEEKSEKAYRRFKRAFNALEKTRKAYASLERRILKRQEELQNGKATK